MADSEIYFFNCYEIDPIVLKGQLQVVNPFQRIFKDFLKIERINNFEIEVFNKENYDKLIRHYYIYKNQFKRYGLTFFISEKTNDDEDDDDEEEENLFFSNKLVFLPKMIFLPDYFFENKFKFSYKGKDYFLLNNFFERYQEKDNKDFFLILYVYRKKIYFNLKNLTQLNHQHKKLSNKDLLYIDSSKLYKKFKSLKEELSEREMINYERIREIPFLLNYEKQRIL